VRWYIPYCAGLLAALLTAAAEPGDRAYREEIQKWREGYEADLKKDNSWLTLAGLFWLKEGANSFGADASSDIALPSSAPEIAGVFLFHNGTARLQVKTGAQVLLNGEPLHMEVPIKPDTTGHPDRITVGRLTMMVIQRGTRYGIRLWDNASHARSDFSGTRWFPVKESYRVQARFVSYPEPKMIPILNILGDSEPNPSPGYALFEIQGRQCRLDPVLEGDQLFFMFKDQTSGNETYPAGRFLYSDLPKDGRVILDFNEAQNPPCAFTAYATCPLPPKQNYLHMAVRAGELNAGHAKN
jgi:uncharacterized protein (DUF1684 family)